jgi:hypothetical protein
VIGDEGDPDGAAKRCNEANAGVENERFGPVAVKLGDGGKRMDFVDQVFTRCRGASELMCVRRSVMKDECSVEGVEGGVFGEANTSNWRERKAREFISESLKIRRQTGDGKEGYMARKWCQESMTLWVTNRRT